MASPSPAANRSPLRIPHYSDTAICGSDTEFPSNGHSATGYLAVPRAGRGPGVLVLQEWWGLVDHIKDVCDRFAEAGFVALAPDLYHGAATKSPDEAGKLFMALNIERAGTDLRGAADALLSRGEVVSSRVGVVGFCMGGQLALYAAIEYPDRIGAAVDFYGVHPNVPIDPARVRVPLQAHFAKRDKSVKEADAQLLTDKINQAGGSIESYYYEADHAFLNDTRPTVYDRASADKAWGTHPRVLARCARLSPGAGPGFHTNPPQLTVSPLAERRLAP